MLFYTIMKLFITLLDNVNKSRTSAGRLSLSLAVLSNYWGIILSLIFLKTNYLRFKINACPGDVEND
jgi:hypothetical protein